jgi:hypothetical protein
MRLSVNFIPVFLLIMSFPVFPVLLAVALNTLVPAIPAIIVLVPVIVFFGWDKAPQGWDELETRYLVPDNRYYRKTGITI